MISLKPTDDYTSATISGLPDFDTLQKMEQEKEQEKEQTKQPQSTTELKYSIVPRFWPNGNEIQCIDVVEVHNKATGRFHVRFIDEYGRMGVIPYEDIGIYLINNPTEEDIEDFQRLKRESNELSKLLDKPKEDDTSVA